MSEGHDRELCDLLRSLESSDWQKALARFKANIDEIEAVSQIDTSAPRAQIKMLEALCPSLRNALESMYDYCGCEYHRLASQQSRQGSDESAAGQNEAGPSSSSKAPAS